MPSAAVAATAGRGPVRSVPWIPMPEAGADPPRWPRGLGCPSRRFAARSAASAAHRGRDDRRRAHAGGGDLHGVCRPLRRDRRRGARDRRPGRPRRRSAHGRAGRSAIVAGEASGPPTQNGVAMIVLGIDPGTASTGYGVVRERRLAAARARRRRDRDPRRHPARAPAGRHPRARRGSARRAPPGRDGDRGALLRRQRRAPRSPSARPAGVVLLAAGQRGRAVALVHAPAGQGRRVRARSRRQGAGGADGGAAARPGRGAAARPRRRRARGGDLRPATARRWRGAVAGVPA